MDPFNSKQLNYRSYVKTIRAFSHKPVTQTSTALVLTLATIAFFGLAAIRPTLSTISGLQAEIKEKEVVLEKIRVKLNSLNSLQREIQANDQVYQNFDKAIPDSQESDELLTKIEILSFENELILHDIRVSRIIVYGTPEEDESEENDDTFPSFLVTISATSQYQNLIDFIASINTVDRYGRIEAINFAEPSDDELSDMLTLVLKVRYYWNDEIERTSSR
jgi:Tfp pilus assembly protein PilO